MQSWYHSKTTTGTANEEGALHHGSSIRCSLAQTNYFRIHITTYVRASRSKKQQLLVGTSYADRFAHQLPVGADIAIPLVLVLRENYVLACLETGLKF
jgi:hypothetical protein